ncbi:MAG: MarR family winged helix-turn-helix transcriptional regulator [Clostridium sp.]|uniref:MarR family winged helix-turn-helix transcriptional regulator n=1 Tax=Clostridium sp. TaxID=1506 RepID=UPI003F3FC741
MNNYKCIGDLIYFISKDIKKKMDEGFKDSNIGQGQILTLMALMRHKEDEFINQDELSEEMGINKANISRNLSKLNANNFIEIHLNEKDQRKKKIILTRKAYDEMNSIGNILEDIFNDMVNGIDEEELKATSEVLNKMKKNLESKR